MENPALAGVKKNAEKHGQTIVFVDESGLSERPTRVRTWAPRGQTPVLQYSFSWHHLSAIAGVTFWQFYFRLFPGSIKGPQLVAFLSALRRQIHGPLLIIWDGLKAHRSKLVRAYVEADAAGIKLEYLPAYAPELNPVEVSSEATALKRGQIERHLTAVALHHDHQVALGIVVVKNDLDNTRAIHHDDRGTKYGLHGLMLHHDACDSVGSYLTRAGTAYGEELPEDFFVWFTGAKHRLHQPSRTASGKGAC